MDLTCAGRRLVKKKPIKFLTLTSPLSIFFDAIISILKIAETNEITKDFYSNDVNGSYCSELQ